MSVGWGHVCGLWLGQTARVMAKGSSPPCAQSARKRAPAQSARSTITLPTPGRSRARAPHTCTHQCLPRRAAAGGGGRVLRYVCLPATGYLRQPVWARRTLKSDSLPGSLPGMKSAATVCCACVRARARPVRRLARGAGPAGVRPKPGQTRAPGWNPSTPTAGAERPNYLPLPARERNGESRTDCEQTFGL